MSKLSVSLRATALLLAVAASSSGCSMFHRHNKLYAATGDARALEVPPDMDTSASSTTAPASVSASATQQAAAQASSLGFNAAGTRDEVFARVGDVLGKQAGVTVTSRAQLLGVYDVTYGGASFLVRVSSAESGAYVSIVDPRGLPATGDAPRRLVETLKAAIAH